MPRTVDQIQRNIIRLRNEKDEWIELIRQLLPTATAVSDGLLTFVDEASRGNIQELDTAIQDIADSTLVLEKAQKILENLKKIANDERELRRATRRRDITTPDRQRGQERRRAIREREYTEYVPAQVPVRQPALSAPPQGWYN